jgi:hypothetical protein
VVTGASRTAGRSTASSATCCTPSSSSHTTDGQYPFDFFSHISCIV